MDGCSSLTYISAGTNNLTAFDGTGAPKLSSIRLKENKLKSAKFIRKSKEYEIVRKTETGSFSFIYDGSTGKLTIYANADNIPSGYKYLKIYDGSKLKKTIDVSKRSSYSYAFTPSSSATTCGIEYTKTK